MSSLTGETPLTIGEGVDQRTLTLVLDHEALIAAETAYGVPLALTMAQASLGFAGAIRSMLFGALRAHHPEMTLKDAGRIAIDHQAEVDAALAAATKAGFPDSKPAGGKDGARPPAKPRGGKSSGANGAKRGSTRKASSAPRRASSR